MLKKYKYFHNNNQDKFTKNPLWYNKVDCEL